MNKVEENEWLWADIDTMAERTNALPILVEKSLGDYSIPRFICLFQHELLEIDQTVLSVVAFACKDVSPYVANKLIDEGDPVGKIPAVELRNTHTQYAITW